MNKAVAFIRDSVNAIYSVLDDVKGNEELFSVLMRDLVKLMAPIAPHICEEIWSELGFNGIVSEHAWPSYNEKYLCVTEINLPVQVNGKLRGTVSVGVNDGEDVIFEKALALPNVQNAIVGKPIRKQIFIKGKIVNFVV